LEELKAPIEVHFANGIPHLITLQEKNVPLQIGEERWSCWFSILGGMQCISGMEFITHNSVFIERQNRLIKIPSKNGIIRVKTHEVPSVGGSVVHLMLSKTWEKECMGGCGMLCVMCVSNEFEPKETTNLVNLPKCVKTSVGQIFRCDACRIA
jgi:hypothetical protein